MPLNDFSLSGLVARFFNVMSDLPNIYDNGSGKIYTGGLSADEKKMVREQSRILGDEKRITVVTTGAGNTFFEIEAFKLNRIRKAQGFSPV